MRISSPSSDVNSLYIREHQQEQTSRWCKLMVFLPGGNDPGDILGGASNEQQRQSREQAQHNGRGAQPAGTTDWKIQPPHQNSTQDGAQHRHGDTHCSWKKEIKKTEAWVSGDPNYPLSVNLFDFSPIIMLEKEMVWLNCLSMNLAMKVARPESSAARLTCARTTSR